MREFYVWVKFKDSFYGEILSKDDFESAINEDCKETSFLAREVNPKIDEAINEMYWTLQKLKVGFAEGSVGHTLVSNAITKYEEIIK